MDHSVRQDAAGTHIDWALDGVTARMIDWFWSNMEKGFLLWHPEQHEPLSWPVPVRDGAPLGAVHLAPQTWDDGRRQNLYLRFEWLEAVPEALRAEICHEHVIIVAGLGFGPEALEVDTPLGYRLHQWSKSDGGVVGQSTAIGLRKPETPAEGLVWAAHAAGEIGNWEVFLPEIYRLYKAVKDPGRNPFADLSVQGRGRDARYRHQA
jgi:hypothetical protein